MNNITLSANSRTELGKADVRRLRRLSNMVPAVVYGGKKEAQAIKLPLNDVLRTFKHAEAFSQLIDLSIDGKQESVVVKDVLPHPYKPTIMHIDFFRVDKDAKLTVKLPLSYLSEEMAPGVKAGGIVSRMVTELEVTCLPKDLPTHLDVDVSQLELGQSMHLSDVQLPAGLSLTTVVDEDHNQAIFNIHAPHVAAEPVLEDDGPSEEPAKDEAAE